MSNFYLTIDDGPSSRAQEKLEFLNKRGVRAIWFVLGENIRTNRDGAMDAVRKGNILGNHSFSHPHFPLTSMQKIRDEIAQTEGLIEEVYECAGIARPAKIFRFPYGEIGGPVKRWRMRGVLKELGFETGKFDSVQFGAWNPNKPGDRHWMWSYDVREWALAKEGIRNQTFGQVHDNLEKYLNSYAKDKNQVILMHDHEQTHDSFLKLIDIFLDRGIVFQDPEKLLIHTI
jgi:peptidoglycan/xylan/chitin deacetylase (PgdA/CDA1 family)